MFLSILAAAGQYVLSAENISGPWHGKIDVGGTRLTLVLRFGTDSLGNAACTLDSPDQGALGIPAQVLLLRDDSVSVSVPSLKAAFQGRFVQEGQERRLTGTFSQVWMRFPLTLQPGEPVRNRPQEPQPPYPYRTEEVRFVNESDGVTLAGTLTWPEKFREGMAPVVLMVTGSGTQNRDEEILGHKPFLVLADFLARNGIASLRYDDRGAGESDRGDGPVTTESNMRDALAGMEYLRGLGLTEQSIVFTEREMGDEPLRCLQNTMSPRCAALLMERLVSASVLRAPSRAFLIEALAGCQTGQNRIAAGLKGVPVEAMGHKTGTGPVLPGRGLIGYNDVAFVRLANGHRYVLAILVKDSQMAPAETEALMASISACVARSLSVL